MRVEWTLRAAQNLDSILAPIPRDSPFAAAIFLADRLAQVDQLSAFPLLGKSGIVPLTRELVIQENYTVFYRVRGNVVQILRVLHVRRKYPY